MSFTDDIKTAKNAEKLQTASKSKRNAKRRYYIFPIFTYLFENKHEPYSLVTKNEVLFTAIHSKQDSKSANN